MNERLSGRQTRALLLAAGSAPVFFRVCALNWAAAIGAGIAAWAGLTALFRLWPAHPGRVVRALGAIGFFALAVWAARSTAAAFPQTEGSDLAACLILALAALAAGRGPAVLGRCAGVLVWVLAGLYGTVLLCGLTQVQARWLTPSWSAGQLPEAAALLLPAAALPLRERTEGEQGDRGRYGRAFAGLAALGAAAAAVTGGVLSPALAARPMAFLTLAKSVSILGVVQRFEALISAALLMSGFCLCALLCSALREELLHLTGERAGRRRYLAAAGASLAAACLEGPVLRLIFGVAAICCVCFLPIPQAVDGKKFFWKN